MVSSSPPPLEDSGGFDDWGDDDDDFGTFTVNGNEGGDWANFEEPAVSLNAKNDVDDDDDDDDDFGDFGDFSENTDFNSFTPQTQENFKSAASPTTESDKPLRVEPGFKANLFSRQRKVSESIVDDVVDEMIKESDNVIPDMLSELNTIDTCLMSKETAVKVTKVK
ncbi:hypothetical protein KUTeg_013073 [Tegillarca granosa]|uniref:Uncharacterized protein n=1 Tax=Tegillarca granosa TaxID=220873 RepID=A0ABQ9ESM3_TEGGR|nr:hypothetical protein KUTeg_013073 [Tegillarca granosa]